MSDFDRRIDLEKQIDYSYKREQDRIEDTFLGESFGSKKKVTKKQETPSQKAVRHIFERTLQAIFRLDEFIKKIGNRKWRVYSEKGKNLGTYNSEEAAKKRLKQVEYFKHQKG